MKKRKILIRAAAVLLLLAAVAGWYLYKEYNRVHKDTANLDADYSLKAEALVNEFQSNEQASNKKYWDRVVELEGLVKDVSRGDGGLYTVILGDTTSLSSIRCSMDSVHGPEAMALEKGQKARVKGICAGYNADELLGSDVILVRCVVSKPDN